MENTPYNVKVMEQLKAINKKYVTHLDKTGKQVLEENMEKFGSFNPKHKKKEGKGLIDDMISGKLYGNGLKGKGFFDDIASGFESVASHALPLLPLLALGKGKKKAVEGGLIKTEPKKARGRPKGSTKKSCGGSGSGGSEMRAIGSGSEVQGSGFFDIKTMSKKKPGRKSKKGGEIGVDAMAQQKNLLTGNGNKTLALAKMAIEENKGKKGKKVKGGAMTESPKKKNWIEHCKNYAKEHGVTYRDALKSAKETY